MSFRYLDMEHYERIEHFRYFLSMPYPYAGVTVDIDVTDIVSFCKARGYSFYLTFLHAATKAAAVCHSPGGEPGAGAAAAHP